ncbi:hypothetical protein MSAN_01529800 [Mycena sanguinolenta]|uniref:Uncharacterized protein n=1 Tax=Mycena sanguinolenta TaxID=230812 RepID=A0A8H6Y513_9AGAR|nr:hypothetical protein MSAN_01529800 [Mycena sanguinolenta]
MPKARPDRPASSVTSSNMPRPQIRSSFYPFSECVIRRLKIVLNIKGTAAVRRQLESFPSVEEPGVSIKTGIATLVNVLCLLHERSSSPMLTNLWRIKLTYDHSMDQPIDYCPVIELEYRRRAVAYTDTAELQSLRLTIATKSKWDWYPNATMAAELCQLIASGLDFRMRAPDDGGVWPE